MSDEKYGFNGSELKFSSIKSINDFVPAFLNQGRSYVDGLTYSLPFLKSTEVLYYNKTFFNANGLSIPTTGEEMWEVCKRIKEIDPKSTPLGIDNEANFFITLAKQYGIEYIGNDGQLRFNNTANKELMSNLKKQFEKGYFTTQTIFGGYCNVIFTDTSAPSRMYMTIGSTGGSTYQAHATGAFETDIAMIPQASNQGVTFLGPSICLFKNDDPQVELASWLFLQYLLSNTSQAEFAIETGFVPGTKTATELSLYKTYLNAANTTRNGISALAAKQAIQQSELYFFSPVFIGSEPILEEIGKLLVSVLRDINTIDELFEQAVLECENKRKVL